MYKNLRDKIIVTVAILLFPLVTNLLGLRCIILEITGYPCLGCGMTRAIVSALKFQFQSAFEYHLMFWSVPILYVAFLLDGRLFKKPLSNTIFYILILFGFIINWILHVIII